MCVYIYIYIHRGDLPSTQAIGGHQDLSCTMVFGKKPVEWDKAKMGQGSQIWVIFLEQTPEMSSC